MWLVRADHVLVVAVACALAGCAGNTSLTGARSAGAVPRRCFWPPPRSTSLWTASPAASPGAPSLAQVGGELAVALRRRGYVQQRWFPVGAGFAHGFAISTRLEHVDAERGERGLAERGERGLERGRQGFGRWIASHPEPANLFWLSGATTVRLPQPGQYRVFLVAFTDLPLGPTRMAPVWRQDTVMEGPEVPEALTVEDIPAGRHLESARLGLYSYVYERPPEDDSGQFVSTPPPGQSEGLPPGWIPAEFTSALEPGQSSFER